MSQAPSTPSDAAALLDEHEAFAIGYHAYLWGYVYVKTMLLRDEATHPDYAACAPLNALCVHTELAKPGAVRHPAGHPRCGVRCSSESIQGQEPTTAGAAHRSLDQPADQGVACEETD